jgi:hypothetical protein
MALPPEQCFGLLDGLNVHVQSQRRSMPHDHIQTVSGLFGGGCLRMPDWQKRIANVALINVRE